MENIYADRFSRLSEYYPDALASFFGGALFAAASPPLRQRSSERRITVVRQYITSIRNGCSIMFSTVT